MKRILIGLGIASWIASAAFLWIMSDGVENEWAMAILGAGLCSAEETMQEELGAYSYEPATDSGGQPSYYYCVDNAGAKRDVGGGALGIIAGGFIGLILLGIFMIILSDKLKFPRPKIAKSPKA